MKPFNIEIFDRNFRFRSSALIDSADFNYKYDALSTDKSSFTVAKDKLKIREIAESGYTGDGTVARSDFVRITTETHQYTGIVTDLSETETLIEVTHEPVHKLFDHEVLVIVDDIKHTTIEEYIEDILEAEFENNSDTRQNIAHLYVSSTSRTSGIFDYNDTDDVYKVINILTDLIYPAFKNYMIRTDININFNTGYVIVSIGEVNLTDKTIEADLPNVIESNFNVRSTTNDVNKLTLVDTANYVMTNYTYYLHPSNYSFDMTNNSDRFFPVVNMVAQFDSDAITEDEFLSIANDSARAIKKYVEIPRNLSSNEKTELSSAIHDFWPYVVASRTNWNSYYAAIQEAFRAYIFTYWNGFAGENYTQVSTYDDLIEEGSGHYMFAIDNTATAPDGYTTYTEKQTVSGLSSTYSVYPPFPTEDWETFSLSGNVYYDTDTHASLYKDVVCKLYIIFNNAGDVTTYELNTRVYTPLDNNMVTETLNLYKQTDQFKTDFAAYKEENFQSILTGYAKKIFKTSKYKNLIELTTAKDDNLLNPLDMIIGQPVNIITKGVAYSSTLTGREIHGDLVTLIFGTVRIELTKILNMKGV